MKPTINASPEYDYLKFLESINKQLSGWVSLYFGLSRQLDHHYLMQNRQNIHEILKKHRLQSEKLMVKIEEAAQGAGVGAIYRFTDNDIMIFFNATTTEQLKKVEALYNDLRNKFSFTDCRLGKLSDERHFYMQFADQKMLSAKRIGAYEELADDHKISSIQLRRSKRYDPRVMIVEDDRFTAAYAASLLNQDFEVIHARNGEEAIKYYIEYAPDTVFLDIHLPGLTGHQTLEAIKAADNDAFIVMMSVDTIRENVISASLLGAKNFLKKPFNKDRLIKAAGKSPFLNTEADAHELLGI